MADLDIPGLQYDEKLGVGLGTRLEVGHIIMIVCVGKFMWFTLKCILSSLYSKIDII